MVDGLGLLLLSVMTALWQFYAVWVLLGRAIAGCLYEPRFALVTWSRGKDAKSAIILITPVAGFSDQMAVLAASLIGQMKDAGPLAMMSFERFLSHHGLAIAAFGLLVLSIALLLFGAASAAYLPGFVILFGSVFGTVSILRPLLAQDILGETNFGVKSGALALPIAWLRWTSSGSVMTKKSFSVQC